MKKKKIKIGLDFDGVVAYNPARVIRAPITYFKREILGIKKLEFYVPKTSAERFIWALLHESSIFPAPGSGRLKQLARRDDLEFHLVTARFKYLQGSVDRWLRRFGLYDVFTGIHLNLQDKQPHLHKLEMMEKLKLDYFVEDNWDIVSYVQEKTATSVFWIYNITDRGYRYPHKFPYLDKALIEIQKQLKIFK
jgi:uncharacterized HAD superfamily protein